LRAEAVEAARGADVAVLFPGLPASYESEGFDGEHILLPESHVALLAAVAEVSSRVVVVLANGSTVRVSDWDDRAAAILEGWLLGQVGGGPIADLLFGRANPIGPGRRVSVVVPRSRTVRVRAWSHCRNGPEQPGAAQCAGRELGLGLPGVDDADQRGGGRGTAHQRMRIRWRLRMAAAQREVWTGNQLVGCWPSAPGWSCPRRRCRRCSPRSPRR
jgi:hypothetical protein